MGLHLMSSCGSSLGFAHSRPPGCDVATSRRAVVHPSCHASRFCIVVQKGLRGLPKCTAFRSGPSLPGISSASQQWQPARASVPRPPAAAAAAAPRMLETGLEAGSVSVILLAGGVGKRMGANMPKQYLMLHNRPIALYSLQLFAATPEVGEIVVVCDPSYRDLFCGGFQECSGASILKFALPGKERQDSVYSGLQEVRDGAALVAVHDSARPLVTSDEMNKVLRDAQEHGAAVLGVRCKATIKEADGGCFVVKTLERSWLWEMHTPQVIRPDLLKEGFDLVKREGLEVTDDVSIVEHLKHPVKITEGLYTNIKITTPDDLLLAERVLSERCISAEDRQYTQTLVQTAT